MNSRKTNADQSEATRGALIAVGRELFATRGYANSFTDEVADRAGVTRGALYHHFRRKEDLFRAVPSETLALPEPETLSLDCRAYMNA